MSGELAGALAQRVAILRRWDVRDDLGGAGGEWAAIGSAWAALQPVDAVGWGAGDRPAAATCWRGVVRVGTDVAVGDRVQWRLLLLAVRTIEADPATPERLTLTLEEVG